MVEASSDLIQIIHVDDEPNFAELTSDFIERQNDRINVETATSASEAFDRLQSTPIDCVVSDYDMPGQNGTEFLESVREDYPDLPFILYTGKGSEEVASDAISAGVTDYLQKETGTGQYDLLANRIANAVGQRRAKAEVKRTEQRLETIAQNTNDILWKFSADWNELRFINSPYEEIWGRSIDELQAEPQSFLQGIHPEDRDRVREAMEALTNGDSVDLEFRVNADEDFGRWVWVQAEPVFNESDEVGDVVGFARDITTRKRHERELVRERDRTRFALQTTDSYVFEIDFETGREQRFGDWESIHGISQDELTTTEEFIERAVHSADQAHVREKHRELEVAAGKTSSFDFRTHPDNGDVRWVHAEIAVQRDEADDALYGIGLATDITELKREQERLSALFENSLDPIVLTEFVDDVPIVRRVNSAFEETFGYPAEQVVGNPIDEFVVPDEEDAVEEAEELNRRFRNDEKVLLEVRRQTESGLRDFLLQSTPIGSEDFDHYTFAIYSDITEQKQHTQSLSALHESVSRLVEAETPTGAAETIVEIAASVLDQPYGTIFLWDEERHSLKAVANTDEAQATFGEPPTFEPGEGLIGTAYDDDEQIVLADAQQDSRGLESGSEQIHGYCVIPLAGHGAMVCSSPERDAFDDESVHLISILASHLTSTLERIEHEQNLQDRHRKLTRLQERTQEMMYTESKVETAEVAVEAAEEIIGAKLNGVNLLDKSGEVLEGRVMTDAVPETYGQVPDYKAGQDPGTTDALVWKAFEEGDSLYIPDTLAYGPLEEEPLSRCVYIVPIEGHGVLIASETRPDVFDETDRAMFDVLANSMITALDRVEREQTLRENAAQLERQNERLEEFASIVSHDLRNPLTVAEGRLGLAREESDSDDLDAVARAHERMNTLIDDLLTLAREGETVGDTEPIDLVNLTENCWQNVATAETTLTTAIDRRIHADESRLEQLLENLIRNAVEHGGEDVTITVGELEGGFYVADDGPGIPENERDEVFDAGYSTTDEGTGFGLSIVKQVAQAHGWDVRVTDGSEGGARFEITGVEFAA